jgi:hypothetical protein
MWSGSFLPHEPGRNKTRKQNKKIVLFEFSDFYFPSLLQMVSSYVMEA